MSRNKKTTVKEYLIEFIIVIFGITIAFWLSNLGEIKKENRLEEVYLEQLRGDISIDINAFDRGIKRSSEKGNFLQKGLAYVLNQDRNKLSADSIAKYAITLGDFGSFFTPTNDTYLTLQQSGDLKIIKNMELKKKLVTLFKYYDIIKNEQSNITQALDDNFFPDMYQNFDLITNTVMEPSFFRSTMTINFIGFVAQESGRLNTLYKNSRLLALETKELLDTELGDSESTQNQSN